MRQFVCAASPNSKGLLEITGKDFHYLRKVLRKAAGDMISLSLPGGGQQEATICKVDDGAKKITLQVCDSQGANQKRDKNHSQAQDCAARADGTQAHNVAAQNCSQAQNVRASRTQLALLQFIPKPQKMELIVRQATECGVSAIVPVIGEYTQAGFEKALQKSDRFEKIIREARQQSGSQVETKIFPPQKLSAALDLVEGADFWQSEKRSQAQDAGGGSGLANASVVAKIFLYERSDGTVPLAAALFGQEQGCSQVQNAARSYGLANDSCSAAASSGLAKSRAPSACVYAVGCEGGISLAEANLLLARGFKGVHFNTNILRCETASLYAAAAIQSALDN